MLLGDLGADVVKVEERSLGDPARLLPPHVGEESAVHAALNRNKRSFAVDLRTEAGAALVKRLARRADVFVESFRPGVLERRGLGADALRAENDRLVYCSLTGYGKDGPMALRAGHDIDYGALGGFLGSNLDREGQSVLPAGQVADMLGGLVATIGILAALMARQTTGRGQVVNVSLLESVLALMAVPLTRVLAGGETTSELSGRNACYNLYRCRDGRQLAVGALEPKFWEGLCRSLGLLDLIGRQWDEDQGDVIAALAGTFATRDRSDWLRELSAHDVCVEPVLDLSEAAASTQVAGSLMEQPCGERRLRTVTTPVRLSETPASTRRPPPALGEHTDEVLSELGVSSGEIESLRAEGIVT
jgi:alpha-methylacyl-CoA racemase